MECNIRSKSYPNEAFNAGFPVAFHIIFVKLYKCEEMLINTCCISCKKYNKSENTDTCSLKEREGENTKD